MNTIQNGITKVYKIYSHTIINMRNIIYTSLDIYKGCQIHISRYTHKTPEQISRDKEKTEKNAKNINIQNRGFGFSTNRFILFIIVYWVFGFPERMCT